MKYAFTLLALCCALTCYAQKNKYKGIDNFPVDQITGRVVYQNVVTVEDVPKDELFNRSKEWFVKTFRDGGQVIQLDDKEAGRLVGKGVLKGNASGFGCAGNYDFPFTLTVEFKDGRYRYELTDIEYKSWVDSQKRFIEGTLEKHTQFKGCEKSYNTMYAQLNKNIELLLASLHTNISTEKENW